MTAGLGDLVLCIAMWAIPLLVIAVTGMIDTKAERRADRDSVRPLPPERGRVSVISGTARDNQGEQLESMTLY